MATKDLRNKVFDIKGFRPVEQYRVLAGLAFDAEDSVSEHPVVALAYPAHGRTVILDDSFAGQGFEQGFDYKAGLFGDDRIVNFHAAAPSFNYALVLEQRQML